MGLVERFGLDRYVIISAGFSGKYVFPFIFQEGLSQDTPYKLSGLISVSPGTVEIKYYFCWLLRDVYTLQFRN